MPKLTRELKALLDKEDEAATAYALAYIFMVRATELNMSDAIIERFNSIVKQRLAVFDDALREVDALEAEGEGNTCRN